jgi:hypothetical protein
MRAAANLLGGSGCPDGFTLAPLHKAPPDILTPGLPARP